MIALDRAEGLWTVTLDRPDKANALTEAMLTELADIAEAAQSEARALILTGAGKVFSAGADLEAARAGLQLVPEDRRIIPGLTVEENLQLAQIAKPIGCSRNDSG